MSLAGALLGLLLLGPGALAEEPAPHPVPAGVPCSQCHEDPHRGTAAAPCASCHEPTAWVPTTFTAADHAEAAFALEGAHLEASCTSCHVRHTLTGLPTDCAECHVDRHRGLLGSDCEDCHSPHGFTPVEDFEHARTGFSITRPHADVACTACHEGAQGESLAQGAGPACTTCHVPGHGDLGAACSECHTDAHATFAGSRASFDHRPTGFHLERRHGSQPCASCHPADGQPPVARCASCHVDPHAGQLGTTCDDCHRPDRWRLARFDHDLTGWVLRGRHFVTPCADCHTSQRWVGLSTECWDCHALDVARAPATVPAHRAGRVDCGDCHGAWRW